MMEAFAKRYCDCNPDVFSKVSLWRFFLCTVVQNNQKYRLKYWATHSSVRLFARTAHSFACTALLTALTRLRSRSLCSLPRPWESEILDDYFFCVFFFFFFAILAHSAPVASTFDPSYYNDPSYIPTTSTTTPIHHHPYPTPPPPIPVYLTVTKRQSEAQYRHWHLR